MLPPPGRPRLLSDPFLSVPPPPNTHKEQALAPWVPGPLRVCPCAAAPWKKRTCSLQPLVGDLRPVPFFPEPRMGRECGHLWEIERLQLKLLKAFLSGSYFLLV